MMTIEQLVDQVAQTALLISRHEEQEAPVLTIIDDHDERCEVIALMGRGTRENVRIAQITIALHDGRLAAVAMEGYGSKNPAHARGGVRIRDLPPGERTEVLMVYGEDRDGNSANRLWEITQGPDGKRQIDEKGEGRIAQSVWEGLFLCRRVSELEKTSLEFARAAVKEVAQRIVATAPRPPAG